MSKFIKLDFERLSPRKQKRRAQDFYQLMNTRRTVRHFSDENVPFELIETAIKTAGTAPSGANLQPWHFVVVRDPAVKNKFVSPPKKEEYENYHGRMPDRWLKHLAPLGTNENKPYLETAPYLIAVFRTDYLVNEETGKIEPTYYSQESVGIAVGMLLAALHNVGLATLTHTPSPMRFLNEILHRPKNERAYVLIPVGYPVEDVEVPNIKRKPLDEIMKVI